MRVYVFCAVTTSKNWFFTPWVPCLRLSQGKTEREIRIGRLADRQIRRLRYSESTNLPIYQSANGASEGIPRSKLKHARTAGACDPAEVGAVHVRRGIVVI